MGLQNTNKTVLITGASGFIGRHLVKHLCPNHQVIAFARRAQKEVGLDPHPNLEWVLVDLMDAAQLEKAFRAATGKLDLDFIFHLAAYYDFGDQVSSEIYEKTNVAATQQLLELASETKVKRFIFTSSLVASKFPEPGDLVYEKSTPDAEYPYAITKRKGEEFVKIASQNFPCSIVRLAAVCSDWCEYEPLYHFLKIWLSNRWDSRILPGYGTMAIPYIHVCCIIALFARIIEKSEQLEDLNIFLASSDKPMSLKELFLLSTRHYYGKEKVPIFIPKFIARIGVQFRDIWGRLIGRRPFERLWMTDYIDKSFPTDCSYTRNTLDWVPKARHQLDRRLLHLIENLKTQPDTWHRMNIDRIGRFHRNRPALILAEEMVRMHEELVEKVFQTIRSPYNQARLSFYQEMPVEDLRWYINVVYNHLLTSVRHGDRSIMITFARDLSHRRMEEDVSLKELCGALTDTRDVITHGLYNNPKLVSIKLLVHDYITLAIQLAMDEIKDVYENVPR
ncbi:MAG: NAD(P)-dependent oxidoreductase [Candidatus Marinimicrobia bacterium]|nr:NAD(P)-dependent oxidoreductase [FCB group bacterium]MBL7024593.1 NAD(P)-dependent oxidoreductase [Candidatus Neomarinimicrobiota bacterium]